MSLGKTEQDLKRELENIASDLKWSAVELKGIAQRLEHSHNQPDAQALLRMITVFERGEARLKRYAEDVQAGHFKAVAVQPAQGADLST
ncbi:hypothetical protein [Pseudomonas japonica]|uniref:hypothetical protein n=1 Tax=Pseudomonas japonica TaxID=256466 RepID=UPI0015E46F19|nr:hypothetical protein [Pseudomonas japonica]MBA1288611.1 hypothetical protein [Pseudomonas japonica]